LHEVVSKNKTLLKQIIHGDKYANIPSEINHANIKSQIKN